MSSSLVLAAISGNALVAAAIQIIVVILVFALAGWLLTEFQATARTQKLVRILMVIVVAIILINILLTFAGRPFIAW